MSKNEYRCRWKKHSKNAIIIVINKYKVEIQNSKTFIEKILGNKGGEITQMTIDEIKKLIQNGEKIDVEFKVSKNTLTKRDIFRTIIPLKKIATQKVGGNSVAQDVAQDKIALAEFIKEKIRKNDKITRKMIANEAGVSIKTIERAIKEINNLKYVGRGSNGHWELSE